MKEVQTLLLPVEILLLQKQYRSQVIRTLNLRMRKKQPAVRKVILGIKSARTVEKQ